MYLVVPFICPDRIIIEQIIESHQMFDLCVAHASRNIYNSTNYAAANHSHRSMILGRSSHLVAIWNPQF